VRYHDRGTSAIELDPDYDKAHYHLIGARAALHESEGPVASYEQRAAPRLRGHRRRAGARQWQVNVVIKRIWPF